MQNKQINSDLDSLRAKIAVGYNRNQLDGLVPKNDPLPFLVFLDWLTYSVKVTATVPDFREINGFTYTLLPHNGRTFKNLVQVYHNNERFAMLSYGGYGAISDFSGQLQIENSFLYINQKELRTLISDLSFAVGIVLTGVSRMDIAVDFPENSPSFPKASDIITGLYSGQLLLAGRSKKLDIYSHIVEGGLIASGFSLGKRSSSKYMRFYNKTLEMVDNPKLHIEKFHTMLDQSQNIWRMEIQLNSAFFSTLNEDAVELSLWGERYLKIVQTALDGFFSFHLNQGKKELNKNDSIDLIDWDFINSVRIDPWQSVTKKPRNVLHDPVKKIHRAIKSNFREYFKNQSDPVPLYAVALYMTKYDLVNWYEMKVSDWVHEFSQIQKLQVHEFNLVQYEKHFTHALKYYPITKKDPFECVENTVKSFELEPAEHDENDISDSDTRLTNHFQNLYS